MSVASVAKLKYILLSLRHLNEGAIAVELDKLSEGQDIMNFYKNMNLALNLKRKNILFIGAPGSGKGTYSRIISPILMIPTLGTGDYMKKEIASGTVFGKQVEPFVNSGKLVPDDIVLPVIQKMLLQPAYKAGVIFDGFPRTLGQAEAISESFPIDLVLQFHLPRDLLIKKLMGRRVCPKCGRSYNVASIIDHEYNLPPLLPKEENHCDNCHEELIVRSDDNLEVIEDRLKVYEAQTAPLLKYYGIEGKNLLRRFDVKKGVADVPDILKLMMVHFISKQ